MGDVNSSILLFTFAVLLFVFDVADVPVLFFQPTSGLDSYNAHSLMETLKTLAQQKNRTIIMSIHQVIPAKEGSEISAEATSR